MNPVKSPLGKCKSWTLLIYFSSDRAKQAETKMDNKMLLQFLQLVLRISIYSQIFIFWCDSLFEGFFPLQSAS